MSKNKVQLSNALINVNWPISERAMNVFMYLVQLQMLDSLTYPDHDTPIIHVDRGTIALAANLQGKTSRLLPIFEELATARFKFETADRSHVFSAPAISAFEYDAQTDMIAVEFSRLFWPYLRAVVQEYTVVDLGVFWQVSGRYAKRFYLDVMRWHKTGELILNLDNLRERYDCVYLYADIQRRIIEPAIGQIHFLTNVKVQQLPAIKKGKRVVALRFVVSRPAMAELAPAANDLIRKYKFSPSFAALIVQRMTQRTISEITAAIDQRAAHSPIKNLSAYAATFFRNYGLTEPKNRTHETNDAAGRSVA